ncbi:MAG: two-component system sensor histidine kinase CreC [Chitinispirillaceae bacterium]|nr:two-component system sensor histidine kinase CreC [Chitinispirillaceae bacterium]
MVTIRTRISIGIFLIVAGGFIYFVNWVLGEMRPHYIKSMEESLIDESVLLASIVEGMISDERIPVGDLRSAFERAGSRTFHARIYDMVKNRINVRVYITDAQGIVIFDSDAGAAEGQDYSRWNDVHLTLKGKYGARTSHGIPGDKSTSVLCVAAPIMSDTVIAGVLTVCKPSGSVTFFIEQARGNMIVAGFIVGLGIILLGIFLSVWVTSPIKRLTGYARDVRDGKPTALPRLGLLSHLGHSEVGVMGTALEEMRDALEGKKYIEHYVQTLTHEIKSPLAAIRGAAELLEEDMPAADRTRFLGNIRTESERVRNIVDRLLELSSLESRKALRERSPIDLAGLINQQCRVFAPSCEAKHITCRNVSDETAVIDGEPFLIRQAIANCLQNAIDFTPPNGSITVALHHRGTKAVITIDDTGTGIPDYALDRIFSRFYSLSRPGTNRKSTGLGLSFVREAITLHGGTVTVSNRPEGGARVELVLLLR